MVSVEQALKREVSKKLLEQIGEPKTLWKYFLSIQETPRPSHKLEKLTEKLVGFGKTLGCETTVDRAGNVIIRRKASPGCENIPGVVLQGHMDMVTSKNTDTEFNFDTDPIEMFINEEGWLQAKGTTLGADNGIGVCAGLAILEEDMKLPMIEVLLTANEETDMSGAENIDPTVLKSSRLLNLDSEEEDRICIGCAGGFERKFHLPITREAGSGLISKKVNLCQASGGHTGIDIHSGLANGIKLLGRILQFAHGKGCDFRLNNWVGGTAINSIPRESFAVVSATEQDWGRLEATLQEEAKSIQQEYKITDPNLELVISPPDADFEVGAPLSAKSTRDCFDFVCTMLHGVWRMSARVPGLVQTSNSLGIVELQKEDFMLHCFARSSSKVGMAAISRELLGMGRLIGAKVSEELCPFPGWDPNPDSALLSVVKDQFKAIGVEPDVYAIHAGLECGLIQERYPEMDCVSIGPQIECAHSPVEKCNIKSTERFYGILKAVLRQLVEEGQKN